MEVSVRLVLEQVFGQDGELVDVREHVAFAFRDKRRHRARYVVKQSVDKERVDVLLHLDEDGFPGLAHAHDVENGLLLRRERWRFLHPEREILDAVATLQAHHCVEEGDEPLRVHLVYHQALEDSVPEGVGVLEALAVLGQVRPVFLYVYRHLAILRSVHGYPLEMPAMREKRRKTQILSALALYCGNL